MTASSRLSTFLAALLLLAARPVDARVLRLDVQEISPAFDGSSFGQVGPYERVRAHATFGLDPAEPENAAIQDLAAAPRDAQGLVEAGADVVILRPADPLRGNGVLLYEAVNRGRILALQLLNDAPQSNQLDRPEHAGNGWLMRQGYTLVWSGWQHDVAGSGLLRLDAPVLAGITGPSRDEWVWDNQNNPVRERLSYPAADRASARLTVRGKEGYARQAPPDLRLTWLDDRTVEISRPAGFDAGAIYELVYTARDPVVGGIGLASVRDLVAFLRTASNTPLARGGAPEMARAYALGVSQSGRFLRELLYLGLNDAEDGRQVFQAMLPHVAGARRGSFNGRFSQPGRNPRQHEDHLFPDGGFPFTYATTTDTITGRSDGLLARCEQAQSCPRIMQTDSDLEAWQSRASLLMTDTRGYHVDLPATVRAYFLVGHPHFAPAGAVAGATASCKLDSNPLSAGPPMRAILSAMDAWVRDDQAPPASRYPTRAHGTLVPAGPDALKRPGLPSGLLNQPTLLNTNRQPPESGALYPVFLPLADADGHAVDGVRVPAVEVPKATYLGINLRRAGYAEGELCGLIGSTVPLPAEAGAGDPRLPLSARYPQPDDYVHAVRDAVDRLVAERLLLQDDADAILDRARNDTLAGLRKGTGRAGGASGR